MLSCYVLHAITNLIRFRKRILVHHVFMQTCSISVWLCLVRNTVKLWQATFVEMSRCTTYNTFLKDDLFQHSFPLTGQKHLSRLLDIYLFVKYFCIITYSVLTFIHSWVILRHNHLMHIHRNVKRWSSFVKKYLRFGYAAKYSLKVLKA